MSDKLILITSFSAITASVWICAMSSFPGGRIMKLIEKICAGALLCWLCQFLLQPAGLSVILSPLASLAAGYLGVPGVILATFIASSP